MISHGISKIFCLFTKCFTNNPAHNIFKLLHFRFSFCNCCIFCFIMNRDYFAVFSRINFCLFSVSSCYVFIFFFGFFIFTAFGMLTVLTTVFLANTVDYGELKNNRRDESVIFSMQTFVVKAASGVAVFLTGIGLDLIGLVGNTEESGPVAVQSAGTLLGLRLMMTVLPMIVLAAALWLFRRKFTLTDARAAEISAQLHAENKGA